MQSMVGSGGCGEKGAKGEHDVKEVDQWQLVERELGGRETGGREKGEKAMDGRLRIGLGNSGRKRRKGARRALHLHSFFGELGDVGDAAKTACSWDEKAADLADQEEQEICSSHSSLVFQKGAMSSALWRTLPDHLLDSILARLPIQSFFRFRMVCRSWNTQMYTRSFLEAYASTPSQGPWFFFFTHDERNHVSTYDSALNKWHKIPLCPPHSNTNPFSAADWGLVCYFSYESGSKSVVVCNPLTRSCRRLPPLLKTPSKVTMLAMVVDRVTKTYKVVVAGVAKFDRGTFQNTAEVYDSQTQCWTATGNIPATYTLKGKPVFAQGCLYVRSQSFLIAYDLEQGVWSDLQTPLPSTVRHGELLQWHGRIMMIGELEENHKIQSICIWELQTGTLKWKEVDRLPAGLFESFFGDKDYFQCNERDDVILDWCQAGRHVLLFTYNLYDVRGRCKLLVYDLSKKSWQKLQSFSRADVCGTGKIIRGIYHEPRLDATA